MHKLTDIMTPENSNYSDKNNPNTPNFLKSLFKKIQNLLCSAFKLAKKNPAFTLSASILGTGAALGAVPFAATVGLMAPIAITKYFVRRIKDESDMYETAVVAVTKNVVLLVIGSMAIPVSLSFIIPHYVGQTEPFALFHSSAIAKADEFLLNKILEGQDNPQTTYEEKMYPVTGWNYTSHSKMRSFKVKVRNMYEIEFVVDDRFPKKWTLKNAGKTLSLDR